MHIRPAATYLSCTKLALVLVVLLTFSAQAYAQSASVSGFVTDASDGRALEMAHVILKADDGSLRGATTNRDGLYIISRLEAGRYRLEARYVGYEIQEDTILIAPRESGTLNIALVRSTAMLDEALVEGERSGGAALVTAGQQTIRAADLEMIPGPDVAGDLASYLTAQPGVVSSGDRGGQLFIRGGEPAHNLLRLLSLPRFISLMADLHVSYSRYRSELGRRNDPSRFSEITNTHIALDASFFGDRIDVDAGTSLRVSTLNSEIGGLFQNIDVQSTSVSNWGSYLELDIDVGGGLHVRPGLRVQFYKVRHWPYPEPRIRAVWERGIHQISAAGGVYHQEIVGLSDRRDAASVFTVWTSTPSEQSSTNDIREGRIQRAVHAIAGYRMSPFPWLDASIEGFYKDLENLFIPEWTTIPQLTTRLEPAGGRAAGADFRLEVRKGPFYSFLNYGLSTTTYTPHGRVLRYWFGEEDPKFRPPHDRRHQINLLVSASIGGFDVSARWQFGSGLPYSRALGFDGFALIDDLEQAYDIQGTRRVLYERPYNAVLPTYHRLDISAERTFRFQTIDMTVQASVINTYDRRNLFYLDVFTLRRVDQLPVVPSIGVKVAFGWRPQKISRLPGTPQRPAALKEPCGWKLLHRPVQISTGERLWIRSFKGL